MSTLLPENLTQGIPLDSGIQAGVTDYDNGSNPEFGIGLSWYIDPEFSWIAYNCWIETDLDSGIVVHRGLPQQSTDYDYLATQTLYDAKYPVSKDGVNLVSKGKFNDTIQRMANPVYRCCLKGQALRAGYQIPFPKLKSFAGVPAIPDDKIPQKTIGPMIVSNNSGVPMYYAAWAFWYTVSVPPKQAQNPPANLAEHLAATDQIPSSIPLPVSQPDSYSTRASTPATNNANPVLFQNPIRQRR